MSNLDGLKVCFESHPQNKLAFSVTAGEFWNGTQTISCHATSWGSGCALNVLIDNAVNFVYLDTDGTLHVANGEFPNPFATPHLPLAIIVVRNGYYSPGDITDCRQRSAFSALGGPGFGY